MTIGIDLGDVWGHYCKLNWMGSLSSEVAPNHTKAIEKEFTNCPSTRFAKRLNPAYVELSFKSRPGAWHEHSSAF
jgi:hypothetical protein